MGVCEIVNVLAIKSWFTDMLFSVSLMFTVSLIVLVRWNFWAVLYPIADAILYCALNNGSLQLYVVYIIGNACVVLSWFLLKLIGKEKVISKWYLSVAYVMLGFVFVVLGRTLASLCFGNNFLSALLDTLSGEVFNIAFAVVAILVLRKINGMLIDQKTYLKQLGAENKIKFNKEVPWEGYEELDEEELAKLTSAPDSGKGIKKRSYDSVIPQDEYPPESR
jgi:hypothetical protein